MAAQAGSLPRPAGQHSAGGRTGLEEDGNSQPTLSDHSGRWVTVLSGTLIVDCFDLVVLTVDCVMPRAVSQLVTCDLVTCVGNWYG